jgi:hypothetical protein
MPMVFPMQRYAKGSRVGINLSFYFFACNFYFLVLSYVSFWFFLHATFISKDTMSHKMTQFKGIFFTFSEFLMLKFCLT